MTKLTILISSLLAVLTLGGCMVTDREGTFYTRSEIDAMAARIECRAAARTVIQIYRCDPR
jgi:hypothetical protein